MRIFKSIRLVSLVLVGVSSSSAVPALGFANDDSKGEPPAKPAAAAKMEAPAPLTERERWLLDRVEQLEKRVADLESKGNTTEAPAASAVLPVSINAVTPSVTAVAPQATEKGKTGAAKKPVAEPFAFADFTWLTGNARTKELAMDTKFFTPEIRADVDYIYDFNHPKDNTISGSSEVFRANEVQVTQLGVGGDFHYDNVRARLMTQFGLYSQTTPRNDASPTRGQWNLDNAYRYLSEAYGGYHFDALYGINVDDGIFM
jgi:hypothetical protein